MRRFLDTPFVVRNRDPMLNTVCSRKREVDMTNTSTKKLRTLDLFSDPSENENRRRGKIGRAVSRPTTSRSATLSGDKSDYLTNLIETILISPTPANNPNHMLPGTAKDRLTPVQLQLRLDRTQVLDWPVCLTLDLYQTYTENCDEFYGECNNITSTVDILAPHAD